MSWDILGNTFEDVVVILPRLQKTKTSAFGVRGRSSHNAEGFYKSKLYQDLTLPTAEVKEAQEEPPAAAESLNRIYCKSSEDMAEVPEASIHLCITSPPYNVRKEYDRDYTLQEYLGLLERVFRQVYGKLVSGGRVCINMANLGRKPYIPLHSYVIRIMEGLGYLMRGEIIWNKVNNGTSTAWGSWLSASNPVLRDVHEYILVFSKDSFTRPKRPSSISKEEFLEFTKSIWTFKTASATKIKHPAPFPEELPYRLIQLYSYEGDVVLDPFCGSGTTCVVALRTNRRYIGYDIEESYVKLAEERINQTWKTIKATT